MNTILSSHLEPVNNFDPYAHFLRNKLHLNPISYGLVIFFADLVVDGLIGWHFDIFLSTSSLPGILQDFMALVTDFIFNPVIAGLYLWTATGSTTLFLKLQNAGVFEDNDAFVKQIKRYQPVYAKRSVFYAILFISLVYMITQIGGYVGWMPWQSVSGYLVAAPQASYARAPFWFISIYHMCFGIFNVVVTILALRKIFTIEENKVQLTPLHPDGCGGLRSISQYVGKIAYGIAVIGIMLTASVLIEMQQGRLLEAYPVMVGIGLYFLMAPLVFFWPLGTAHSAMEEAKSAELILLAEKFEYTYTQIKKDSNGGLENEMQRLRQLKELYEIADNFPVWPFDTRSLRQFFAVVSAPLVPAIITFAFEIIKELLV